MKPEERLKKYLGHIEDDRLKASAAYVRMISYSSKIMNNDELLELMSEEEKEKLIKDIRIAASTAKRVHKALCRIETNLVTENDDSVERTSDKRSERD